MSVDVTVEMSGLVKKVASHVASQFPQYVSEDDVAQNLWVWVYEKVNTVADLIRNDESWEAKLYSTLKRVAYSSAEAEEAETNGYSPEDVYHYTIPVIKTLLPDIFDYEDWQSFQTDYEGMPKSKKQANTTGDRVAMLADVKSAYERLGDERQAIIAHHYRDGGDFHLIGTAYGISAGAARARHDRALGALQRELGRKSSSQMRQTAYDRRKVSSNAGVQFQTDRDWNG